MFSRKQLVSEILKRDQSLDFYDGFFYFKLPKRIMCGFTADKNSTGSIGMKRFAWPMFLGFDHPGLLFGHYPPVPNAFLPRAKLSAREVADQVLLRLDPCREEIGRLADIDYFLDDLRKVGRSGYGSERNPVWIWGFCMTLIAAGQLGEAKEKLIDLAQHVYFPEAIILHDKFTFIKDALTYGNGAEIALLKKWESEFRFSCHLVKLDAW